MDVKQQVVRPWDTIPSSALLNIFQRTSLKDRSHNVPFVCTSWSEAARHPLCWASMIAQHNNKEDTYDHAFVTSSCPYEVSFVDPFDGPGNPDDDPGVNRLHGIIEKARGGVTSVYLFPFLSGSDGDGDDDEVLRLVALRCPNLKHISFHGSFYASQDAILEVFQKCTKLELVDFSNSPYFNPSTLGALSSYCPNIRGIRSNAIFEHSISDALVSGLPSLKLLNLSRSNIFDKDLLNIVTGLKELRYLDITGCNWLKYYMHIIKVASARIPQIVYD